MKAIDLFIPLFELGDQLKISFNSAQAADQSTSVDDLRGDIDDKIKEIELKSTGFDYRQAQFKLALFAVTAWLDELVLESNWQARHQWAKQLLQKSYFDTTNAGELFYQKLDNLTADSDPNMSVRAIYFACLKLGFQGKYFEDGEQARRQEIIQANAELLQKQQDSDLFVQVKPQADISLREFSAFDQIKDYLHILLPLGVLILLFLSLRHDLFMLASNLVKGM